MTLGEVMNELEALGSERTKKIYMSNGAQEPLFGVATGAMKPLLRKIKTNQQLAEELYATRNYDAMYFAGMIADPKAMTEADFNRWIEKAYFPMASNYIVAVTLAESDCAQAVADRWINSQNDLYKSAGWSCYEWLLGWRPDEWFNKDKIEALLHKVVEEINQQPDIVCKAMNNFIVAVGVSYAPLHEEAVKAAPPSALDAIMKAKEKGRLGFKRKAVRC